MRGLLFTAALFALAAPLWLPYLGVMLVVADPLVPANAVIPLAGGHQRARYAVEIFAAGYATCFVATDLVPNDAGDGWRSGENRAIALENGIPPTQIRQTTGIVRSTYEEAQAIRELAEAQDWRSLIIVTSPTHTRRTRLIMDEVFRDSAIVVMVHPVVGYDYNPAGWWRDEQERKLTLWEYLKLTAFFVGYR